MSDQEARLWKSITVALVHPIKDGEGDAVREISAIEMREPDVEALDAIEKSGALVQRPDGKLNVSEIRAVIVALSGLSHETIGRMHAADFRRAGEAMGPLLSSLVAGSSADTSSTA